MTRSKFDHHNTAIKFGNKISMNLDLWGTLEPSILIDWLGIVVVVVINRCQRYGP